MLNVDSNGGIHLTRGDTARFSVSIENTVSDEVYELGSNDTLTLTVKGTVNDLEHYVQKTVVGSNQIHIEPIDTHGMKFGSYIYDVQLTTETGDVYTIIPPTVFEILKEVTY